MASIIEKYASQDVTLLQDPVVTDGKITYKTRIEAKAIVSEFKEADEQYFGKILCNGREYEIKGVRIYKNLFVKSNDEKNNRIPLLCFLQPFLIFPDSDIFTVYILTCKNKGCILLYEEKNTGESLCLLYSKRSCCSPLPIFS